MSRSTLNSNKSFKQSDSHESIAQPIDFDEKAGTDSSVNISVIEERKQSKHMQPNTYDANQDRGSNYKASSDCSSTLQHLSKGSDIVKTSDDLNDVIIVPVVAQKTVPSSSKENLKTQGKHLKGRTNVIAKSQEFNTQSFSLKYSGAKEDIFVKENAKVKHTTIEDLTRTPLIDSTEQFSFVKEGNSNEGSKETNSTLNKINVYQTAIQNQPWDIHLNQKLELTEGMSRVLLVRLERIDNLIKMYKSKTNVEQDTELPDLPANKIERKASTDLTDLNLMSKPKPNKVRSQSLTQENNTSFNSNQQDASSTLPVIKKTVEESSNTSTRQSNDRCTRSWSADCVVCKEKFMDRLELHKHATLSHSDKQILFCEFCGKTFLRENTLKSHRSAAHHKQINIKKKIAKELLKKRKQDRLFKQQQQEIATAECVHRAKLALAMDFQESVNNDTDQLTTPTKEALKTRPKIQLNAIKSEKQIKKDVPQKNRLNNNRQLPCISTICKNQLFNSSEVERKKYLLRLRSRFHQTFSDVQKLKERSKINKDPVSCSTSLTSIIKTEEEDEVNEKPISCSLSSISTEKTKEHNTIKETVPSRSASRLGIRKMKCKINKKLVVPLIRLEDIPTTQSIIGKTGKLAYLTRKRKAAIQKKKTVQCNRMRNKDNHALDLVVNVASVKKNVKSSKSKKNEESYEVTTNILQKQNDATSDKSDKEIIVKDENTAISLADDITCDNELEQILSSNIHTADTESLESDARRSSTAITKNNLSNVSNQDAYMMKESTILSNDSVEKAIEDLFRNGTQVENIGQGETVQDAVMSEHCMQKSDEDKYFENHMTAIHGTSCDSKKVIRVDKHVTNTSAETPGTHQTKASTTDAKKNVYTTNLPTTENSGPKSDNVNVQETSLKSKQNAKIVAEANYKKNNSISKRDTTSRASKQYETKNVLQLDADNEKSKMQKTFSKIVETKNVSKVTENKESTAKKYIQYPAHKKGFGSVEKSKEYEKSHDKATPAKLTCDHLVKEVTVKPDIEQEVKLQSFGKSYSPRSKYLEEAVAILNKQPKPFGTNLNTNGLCSMCKNVLESMIELKDNQEDQETPIKCPFCDSYFVSFHFLECHVEHVHTTCNCKTITKMAKTPQKNVNCKVNEELAFECRYCPKRFDSMTEFNSHAINAHSTSANCKGFLKINKSESVVNVQSKKDEVKSPETTDNLQKADKSIEGCKKDEVSQNKESCQDKMYDQSKSIDGKNKSPTQNYSVKKYAEDYTITCRPCHVTFSSQQDYIHHIENQHERVILSAKDMISNDISKSVKKSKNLSLFGDPQEVVLQKNVFEKSPYNSSSLGEESGTNNSIETDERSTQNEIRESNNDVKGIKDKTVSKETSSRLHDKDSTDNGKGKVPVSDKVVTKLLPSRKSENKYKQSCVPTTSHSNIQKLTFPQNIKTYTRNKSMDTESKMSISGNDKETAATMHIEKLNLTQREKTDVAESVHTLYPCSGCKEVFLDLGRLNQHRATNHRSYFRFVCDICFMSFKKLEDVSMHKLRHEVPKALPNKESPQSTTKEITTVKSTTNKVECKQKKVKTTPRNSSAKDIVRKKSNSLCKSLATDWEQLHSSNEGHEEKLNNYMRSPWKANDLFDLSSESMKDDCTLNSNIMQCHSFRKDNTSVNNNTNDRQSIKIKTANSSKSIQYFASDIKNTNNAVSSNKGNDTLKYTIQNQSLKENRSYELESILTDDRSVLQKDPKKDLGQEKNINSSLKPLKFKITNNIEEIIVKVISKSKSTPESKSTKKNQSGLLGKRKITDRDRVPSHETPVKVTKISKFDNNKKIEKTAIKVQCYICDKQFDLQEELNRHMHFIHKKGLEHMPNNCSFSRQLKKERVKPKKINVVPVATSESVTCEHCAMQFNSVSLMENHKSIVHKSLQKRTWLCDICNQSFTLLQKYLLHRFYTHNDQSLVHVCENCDKVLTSVAMVNVHLCENVTSWSCRPCNKNFSNSIVLRAHNTEAHLEMIGPHTCDTCKMEFLTVSMLNRHKNTEHSSVVSSSCERISPTKNVSSNEYRFKYVEKSLKSQIQEKTIPKTKSQQALEVLLESMVDSHKSNHDPQNDQIQSETKTKKFPCSLCKQICQTKVGLKIHLTRRHQTTAEVCHICCKVCICEKMIHHIINEHIVYAKSNEIESATADQSDTAEQYEDRIDEILGMKRLLSLCEYEVFNDEPRGKCLSCPLCPQLFATSRFFKIHHLWSHDTLCVMCDVEFKSSQEAAEHKARCHGSVGSYMWIAEKLVKAVIRTKKYGENIRNVIFEVVSKELGKCSGIVDVEMNDVEKKQEESDIQTNCSYNSELPDSTNLGDLAAKTNDSELQDLLEDYRDNFSLTQEQENILDILEESDKNDDRSVSEDETMERLKELIREEIKEIPSAVFCPKGPEELGNDMDDENFVLVVTEEDLIQYRNNIRGLASRITSTCSIFSIEDIEKLLTDYMQSIQKTQMNITDKD